VQRTKDVSNHMNIKDGHMYTPL